VRSVRRTLLVALLATVVAISLSAVAATYRTARAQIDQIFDYHLRQIALSLSDQALARAAARGAGRDLDFVIQIWDEDGGRLYLSRPAPGLPEVAELGFQTVGGPSGAWRVYSAALGGRVIQVAQPLRVREELAFSAALRTLAPVALLLPLLALLVWRIVGHGLQPFDRLAQAAASRTPAALEAFSESGAPQEALPLVRALNDLLGRLRAALAAQRAFVADAAHELRTPLAALKLQVQLAQRAPEGAERTAALGELEAGLERATRLVQQLLTLSRVEPEAAGAQVRERVRLADLVRQAVADHALLAEAKRVDLGATEAAEDAVTLGDAGSLRTLLANLVDNAIRYTPEGGRVDVGAGLAGRCPFLEVADTGPGIAAGERERVFDRFYRVPGADGSGSGLGLAVVRAIAERHAATVTLGDAPGGGLTVRVSFPALVASPDRAGPP
jgi:two-component system, OmpR family, sensor kinase